MGLEHHLWRLVASGVDEAEYGQGTINVALLRDLSETAGGWIAWDESQETEAARWECETPLPMDAWLERHAAWEAAEEEGEGA